VFVKVAFETTSVVAEIALELNLVVNGSDVCYQVTLQVGFVLTQIAL
jgi:flavin-binding protein dodecin